MSGSQGEDIGRVVSGAQCPYADHDNDEDEARPGRRSYGRGAAGPQAGAAWEDDVRMRVVADHIRSALMLISDGVRPGNDGRGYVLRRLIRRAVRSMRLLGVEDAAMPTLLTASKDAMRVSYPELEVQWPTISEVAYAEEDAFRRTLDDINAIGEIFHGWYKIII